MSDERAVTPSAPENESRATVDSDFPLDALFGAPNGRAAGDPFGPTASPAGPLEPTRALVGQRLGHYLLLAELGRGGMGVVYAAQDEKLDRKVAIKMLKVEGHPMLQRRLVREAKAMAKLAHPNVISVYEIGEHEGLTFIVMEHVQGRTLREWLGEGPRSVAEIVTAFMAAGRGLAAIHAAGLVHRDFKPDNLMIRTSGQVLVMDLGIARGDALSLPSPEPALDDGSSLVELTRTGALVGSPGYMPAEQLGGQEVTAKTDQFSFCVSLWEALYGARPFEGHNLAVLMESVSTGRTRKVERRDVPGKLHAVLERGLRAAPTERFESMDALLEALERVVSPRRRGRLAMAMQLGGMFALVGVLLSVVVMVYRMGDPPAKVDPSAALPEPVVADPDAWQPRQVATNVRPGSEALSPDGEHLVYEADDGSGLMHIDLRTGETWALPIPIQKVGNTFLFDDGTLIAEGYVSGKHRIYRMKLLDGTPEPIGPDKGIFTYCVFPKHDMLAFIWMWESERAVFLYRADGTLARKLPLEGEFEWILDIACDPQNDRVALQQELGDNQRLVLLDLDGGPARVLFEGSAQLSSPEFDRAGETLYYLAKHGQQQSLEATRVSENVDDLPITRVVVPNIDASTFSRAGDGRIAFSRVQHTRQGIWRISATSSFEHAQRIVNTTANLVHFALSPDERRLAYVELHGEFGRLMIQPLSGEPAREIVRADQLISVAWSPDGETLAFTAKYRGSVHVWTVPAAGGEPTVLERTLPAAQELAWAPGESIIYQHADKRNFGVLDPDAGDERPLILDESVGWAFGPTVSPDGNSVAVYWDREDRERAGIWTIDIADGTERLLSATPGWGHHLGWSLDGRVVYDASGSPLEIHRIPVAGGEPELVRTLDVGPRRRASCLVMTTEELVCSVLEISSDIWMADGVE